MKKNIVKKKKDMLKKKVIYTKSYIQKLLTCKDCLIFNIAKNGDFLESSKTYLSLYEDLLTLLNNMRSFVLMKFPVFYGRNENDLLDKISILQQCAIENIIMYIPNYSSYRKISEGTFEDIYVKGKTVEIVFFKHSKLENFVKVYFYDECEKGKIPNFKINTKNIQE